MKDTLETIGKEFVNLYPDDSLVGSLLFILEKYAFNKKFIIKYLAHILSRKGNFLPSDWGVIEKKDDAIVISNAYIKNFRIGEPGEYYINGQRIYFESFEGHLPILITALRISTHLLTRSKLIEEGKVTTALDYYIRAEIKMFDVLRTLMAKEVDYPFITAEVINKISELSDGECVLLSSGFSNRRDGGHAIYMCYKRVSENIESSIFNYGFGCNQLSAKKTHYFQLRDSSASPYLFYPIPLGSIKSNKKFKAHVNVALRSPYDSSYMTGKSGDAVLRTLYDSLPSTQPQTKSLYPRYHRETQLVGNCAWYNQAFILEEFLPTDLVTAVNKGEVDFAEETVRRIVFPNRQRELEDLTDKLQKNEITPEQFISYCSNPKKTTVSTNRSSIWYQNPKILAGIAVAAVAVAIGVAVSRNSVKP